jgi:hypothetical protein
VGQSFFDPLPTGADVYLLKSVLSNWPDAEARQLLKRCGQAAGARGKIVILNGVIPDEENDPDLLMLVLVGGKQRTMSEFFELAQSAGLTVRAAGKQPSGRFVVECRAIVGQASTS